MEISKKSWHFKVYNTFYKITDAVWSPELQTAVIKEVLPKSLCSYFWMVITGVIFGPIVFITDLLGYRLLDKFFNKNKNWSSHSEGKENGMLSFSIIGPNIVVYTVYFVLFCIVYFFFNFTRTLLEDKGNFFMNLGAIFVIILILSGIIWGIGSLVQTIRDYIDNRLEKPKKEPSIFSEYVKAKYNKVCPRLTYKD